MARAPKTTHLYAAFSSSTGVLKRKGPFARLVFEVEMLREKEDGPPIAEHKDHAWHLDGERFLRLDVEGRVELQFLDGTRSERHGPYGIFSSFDGVAYHEGEVIAYADAGKGKWIRRDGGGEWPVLLVEPAR